MRNIGTVMEHKGFYASIMEAERLVGDQTFGLPPGNALKVYPVDLFKTCPGNWMKGPGVFVVPVRPGKGLWFNWRQNDELNTAVIPTVKGCNPITGLQTTGFHLEKYETKCPKHGCDFQVDRYCPECGYKWPDRGYVSGNPLWWDGFRAEDGSVRQFFFTEEMMRDVATHMIGSENTVPAFGFAFYSPKVRREAPKFERPSYIYHTNSLLGGFSGDTPKSMNCTLGVKGISTKSFDFGDSFLGSPSKSFSSGSRSIKGKLKSSSSVNALYSASLGESERSVSLDSLAICREVPQTDPSGNDMDMCSVDVQDFQPAKEVAVGAGAKIRQSLPTDHYDLDTWKDTPDSVMTIYFVFQEEFNKMAEGGFRDFSDKENGMLNGLPVG